MPSVLAEISFLTNREDAGLLQTEKYRQQIAEALLAGIMRYQQSLKTAPAVPRSSAAGIAEELRSSGPAAWSLAQPSCVCDRTHGLGVRLVAGALVEHDARRRRARCQRRAAARNAPVSAKMPSTVVDADVARRRRLRPPRPRRSGSAGATSIGSAVGFTA